MRVASPLVVVLLIGAVAGCRAAPGGAPFPEGKEVRVQAGTGGPFVLHLAGTGGLCQARLAVGTVRRATADSIFFTTLKLVEAAQLGDPLCVKGRAGILAFDEAQSRPVVSSERDDGPKMAIAILAAVALGLLSVARTP